MKIVVGILTCDREPSYLHTTLLPILSSNVDFEVHVFNNSLRDVYVPNSIMCLNSTSVNLHLSSEEDFKYTDSKKEEPHYLISYGHYKINKILNDLDYDYAIVLEDDSFVSQKFLDNIGLYFNEFKLIREDFLLFFENEKNFPTVDVGSSLVVKNHINLYRTGAFCYSYSKEISELIVREFEANIHKEGFITSNDYFNHGKDGFRMADGVLTDLVSPKFGFSTKENYAWHFGVHSTKDKVWHEHKDSLLRF